MISSYDYTVKYQLITDEIAADKLSKDIDALFKMPIKSQDITGKTVSGYDAVRYREKFKHPIEDIWALQIGVLLLDKCEKMPKEEQLKYYDPDHLVDYSYLSEHGWFESVDNSLLGEKI